jgi:galactose mutarotase-like enzyme
MSEADERSGSAIDDRHIIGSASLSAAVSADGAELRRLTSADGADLLWHGGPQWPRHAPVLFPIVGRLVDDTLLHEGRSYRLTQHGFARDRRFDWIERGDGRAVLELRDDAATRAVYPFAFRLIMTYEVEGRTLTVTTGIENPGDHALPCGVGAHPAFRWPLVDGVPRDRHRLEFDAAERPFTLVVRDGLLGSPAASPIDGRRLRLTPDLFADDALVLPDVASRSVRFVAEDAAGQELRAIEVAWEGYKDLGIWSKPSGAPFLCIEPWYGMSSPIDWQGEFAEKPGILTIEPGGVRRLSWRVTV